MANIVIVTRQCYLLCQAITYIAVNEANDRDCEEKMPSIFSSRPKRRKKLTKKQLELKKIAEQNKQYQIIIDFTPVNNGNPNHGGLQRSGNGEGCTLAINVTGKEACLALFSDMVGQIREQIPDQLFLDTLVQRFLTEQMEANKE